MSTATFDAFSDAQARLDNCPVGVDGYTREQAAADEVLCAAYDEQVLQPAHDAFQARLDALAAESVHLPPVIFLRIARKRGLPAPVDASFETYWRTLPVGEVPS